GSFLSSPDEVRLATRVVLNSFGLPKIYLREGRSLSAPSSLQPQDVGRAFLKSQTAIFALTPSEIDRLRLTVEDVSGNANFISFNQTIRGVDVFNGQIKFTLNKQGEVIQVATADLVPGLDINTSPGLS